MQQLRVNRMGAALKYQCGKSVRVHGSLDALAESAGGLGPPAAPTAKTVELHAVLASVVVMLAFPAAFGGPAIPSASVRDPFSSMLHRPAAAAGVEACSTASVA